ncbi:MAG: cupin domain-containing protein [Gammaproteobacteria bacterium]
MPKLDPDSIPRRTGSTYPPPFDEPCRERKRRALGDAGSLSDFGVNLLELPPGGWSSQRHWHSAEDEFVYVIEGEVVLIDDAGEHALHAGDCAAFPKDAANGHQLINRSDTMAVCLEVGSRRNDDVCTYSDIDMRIVRLDKQYTHKDGRPYPEKARG